LRLGVAQDVLSYGLGVWCSLGRSATRRIWLGPAWRGRVGTAADEHSEHLAVVDAGLLERLGGGRQRAAVEEEVLRVGGEAGLGLDEALEVLHGEARGQVEGQQVGVGRFAVPADGYGDAGPI
jgi:hypothetical protein